MTKLFLSHAWEDKAEFVRPLAERLRADFDVWYDEYELTLGDRLLEKIDQGLRSCDYGVVVLSRHFFSKQWPREELEGLFGLETKERKVILPVWKGVSKQDVQEFSPILASRLGVSTDLGLNRVVHEIKRAVGLVDRCKALETASWKEKFVALDSDITHRRAAEGRSRTVEGVQQVVDSARGIISEAEERVDVLIRDLNSLELDYARDPNQYQPDSLEIRGPKRLSLRFHFDHRCSNSMEECRLFVDIFRRESHIHRTPSSGTLEEFELVPRFDREFQVCWEDRQRTFSTGAAVLNFAFEHFLDLLSREMARDQNA